MSETAQYPEHDKLEKVQEQSQTIGEFLEWLSSEKEIHLARWHNTCDLRDVHTDKEKLLAEFFGIDLKKLEEEKRQMIEVCRQFHKEGATS
jgi:hypothetical protein